PINYLRDVMERFPRAAFYNLFGPTETNVCTYYPVPRPLPPTDAPLPIGRACPNIEAFALTDDGRSAGPGEEGQLLVRGPCVMLEHLVRLDELPATSTGKVDRPALSKLLAAAVAASRGTP